MFVIHIIALEVLETAIHLFLAPLLAILQKNKVFTNISLKYKDYTDIYSFNQIIELSKNSEMNKYTIKLLKARQLIYKLIYSLSLVELEILKSSIKTHPKTGFIQLSNSRANAPIFFDKKPNGSLYL